MNIPKKEPANLGAKSLTDLERVEDPEKYLEQKERKLWLEFGLNKSTVMARMEMIEHEVRKEQTRRACISAKSQRTKKTQSGFYYQCEVYDNLTTVTPKKERDTGIKPPDNPEDPIYRFSKRSRQRLMNRARRLNKSELPLPVFITLTYHKNMRDPVIAKNHLNTFLQRWRRKSDDFAYFWKMEPQKRGAVHFHLAGFIPEALQKKLKISHSGKLKNLGKEPSILNAIRQQVQKDWAEVTRDIDGVDVPYTKFDYIRKQKFKDERYTVKENQRTVKTRCANPRVNYKIEPDFEHLFYGTNVRQVDNWKMFLGYMFKYMQKEIEQHPFGAPEFKGKISADPGGYEQPPYRFSAQKPYALISRDLNFKRKKTGRFWGFSYNLDFEALKIGMADHENVENVNDFCNALNAISFARLTEHLVENAKRKKQQYPEGSQQLKQYLSKYRAIYEKQKKRYLMQKDKLNRGYGMQFEISSEIALKCEQYLKSKSVGEFFDYP